VGFGAVQAETIKAIGKAQMQGPFHVEQVQAPHANISLGQEFLNKIAGRAFAGKRVDTGAVGIITPEAKNEPATAEQKKEQAKVAGRAFAEKDTAAEKVMKAMKEEQTDPEKEKEEVSGLKDKQKFLMLGDKAAEA